MNVGNWKWSTTRPWPKVESVLNSKLWKSPDYQGLRQRLQTPLMVPVVQYEGEFISIGPKDATAEELAKNPVIHITPLGKGTPVPAELSELKFKIIFMELRPDVGPYVHPVLGRLLMQDVPMVVAGVTPFVRQVTSELEALVGEKIHIGTSYCTRRTRTCSRCSTAPLWWPS